MLINGVFLKEFLKKKKIFIWNKRIKKKIFVGTSRDYGPDEFLNKNMSMVFKYLKNYRIIKTWCSTKKPDLVLVEKK